MVGANVETRRFGLEVAPMVPPRGGGSGRSWGVKWGCAGDWKSERPEPLPTGPSWNLVGAVGFEPTAR